MSQTLTTEQIEVQGRSVRLLRRGERRSEADLPVLVLHGWGAGIEAILPATQGLHGETEIIVPDMPGHGGSDDLPDEGWSSQDFAAWALALLDRLGVPAAHVLAHSHGARVTACLAAAHPQRIGRVLLCDAAGLRRRRGAGWYARVAVAKLGRVVGAVGGPPGRRLQQRMRSRVGSRDWLDASPSSRATLRKILPVDLSDEFRGVRSPTLLVWGSADDDTPLWMGRRLEELIPDAGLVVLEGAGHFAYADEPARFAVLAKHFLIEQPRTVAAASADSRSGAGAR